MFLSKRVALAIAGVAAAAVVGTAGVAAATAPAPSGSPSPTASPTSPGPDNSGPMPHRHGKHRGWMRLGALHGEFVVKGKDGGYVTLVTVRGQVTAVSATSITFKAEDGFTATYAVTSDTKVRGHDVDKITDVKVGDRGGAVGTKSGGTVTARAVLVRR